MDCERCEEGLSKDPSGFLYPTCVCDFLLDKLRVIRLEPHTIGSVLDNGRSWTRCTNDVEEIL